MPPDYSRTNREAWDRMAADYQRISREMGQPRELTWGWWRHPERELKLLGNVMGLRVLDLGCGEGNWARQVTAMGATVVGIDLSGEQLKSVSIDGSASVGGPWFIHGDTTQLPFAPNTFDVVVSSWGAFSFTDPEHSIPEAADVLRPGGRLIVCTWSPIFWLCTDEAHEEPALALRRAYFDLAEWRGSRGTVRFQRPYGEWIRLFAAHGLAVERLVEPKPGADVPLPAHFDAPVWTSWIVRFPFDCVWVARKRTAR